MRNKPPYLYIALFVLALLPASCGPMGHRTKVKENLPSLGSIGEIESYITGMDISLRGTLEIDVPLAISVAPGTRTKWMPFVKKGDSTGPGEILEISIVDRYRVIEAVNKDRGLKRFLAANPGHRIVTTVLARFPGNIQRELLDAQGTFLVMGRQGRPYIETHYGDRQNGHIPLSDGKVLGLTASEFCWGNANAYNIEITDLVDAGQACSDGSHKDHKRAKRKSENTF